MSYYERLYTYLTYTTYILYVLAFLGLWNSAPTYLDLFQSYLKLLVSLILIYYYNPFFKQSYNKIHKDVAFTAGLFLLTSTSFDIFIKGWDFILNVKNNANKLL